MTYQAKGIFYRQISVMLLAGIPLERVFQHLAASGTDAGVRAGAAAVGAFIRAGRDFTSAAADAFGAGLTPFEQAVLKVGESSGTLPEVCRRLADYFDFVHRMRSRLLTGFFYPAILLHAVIIIPALPALFNPREGAGVFFLRVVPPLAILYGAVIGGILCKHNLAAMGLLRWWDTTVLDVPVFGRLVRSAELTRFLQALVALYSAGVPVVEAMDLAAGTVGNTIMREQLQGTLPALRRGTTLTEALRSCTVLSPVVRDMFATGEESGRLDEALDRTAGYLQQEVDSFKDRVVAVVPVVVYLAVALLAGTVIIRMWSGLLGRYGGLLN